MYRTTGKIQLTKLLLTKKYFKCIEKRKNMIHLYTFLK